MVYDFISNPKILGFFGVIFKICAFGHKHIIDIPLIIGPYFHIVLCMYCTNITWERVVGSGQEQI